MCPVTGQREEQRVARWSVQAAAIATDEKEQPTDGITTTSCGKSSVTGPNAEPARFEAVAAVVIAERGKLAAVSRQ